MFKKHIKHQAYTAFAAEVGKLSKLYHLGTLSLQHAFIRPVVYKGKRIRGLLDSREKFLNKYTEI